MTRIVKSLWLGLALSAAVACSSKPPVGGDTTPPVDPGNPGNNPPAGPVPTLKIIAPVDGVSFRSGTLVHFEGSATDAAGTALTGASLVWTSSLDGQLLTGAIGDKALTSVGSHVIQLAATDAAGRVGTASVSVNVADAQAPIVQITRPKNGDKLSVIVGNPVRFTATAFDFNNIPIPPANISWKDSLGDVIPGGANPQAALSAGTHTVTCTAADPNNNKSASASVTFTMVPDLPPNLDIAYQIPTLPPSLMQATNPLYAKPNAPVTVIGTAIDPESGNLSANIKWTLDPGAQNLGTGAQRTFNAPAAAGDYTVTATVQDFALPTPNVVSKSFVLRVVTGSLPPICQIGPPQNGARLPQGTNQNFAASCFDPDAPGTAIPQANIHWTSNLQGPLGLGTPLRGTVLTTVGDHTVTVCADDVIWPAGTTTAAAQGCASVAVTLFANTPPVCTVTAPTANQVINEGVPFQLVASAVDAQDPVLTYSWDDTTAAPATNLANTPSATTTFVGAGARKLTFTGTDPWNASCSVTVSVTINAAPVVNITGVTQGAGPTLVDCLAGGPCRTTFNLDLAGTAADNDGVASYEWVDSVLGSLGVLPITPANTNATLAGVINQPLLEGMHSIALKANDTFGSRGSALSAPFAILPVGAATLATDLAVGPARYRGVVGNLTMSKLAGTLVFVDGNGVVGPGGATGFTYDTTTNISAGPANLSNNGMDVSVGSFNGVVYTAFATNGNGFDLCQGGPDGLANCVNWDAGALRNSNVDSILIPGGTDLIFVGSQDGVLVTRLTNPGTGGTLAGTLVLRGSVISHLASAGAGAVWAATDRGVALIQVANGNPATATVAARYNVGNSSLPTDTVFGVAVASTGEVFFGTNAGLAELQPSTGTWTVVQLSAAPLAIRNRVYAVAVETRTIGGSNHTVVWAGTRDGLVRWDPGIPSLTVMTTADGLPNNNVLSIYIDAANVKWIGTNAGLASYAGY